MKRTVFTCCFMLLLWFDLLAFELNTYRDSLFVQIKFRQGYSFIDTSFSENSVHLSRVISLLNSALADSLTTVQHVTIKGSASPEGYTKNNRFLAKKRALNMRAYILNNTSLADSVIRIVDSDVDWGMLSDMIDTTDQPWRKNAVKIIKTIPIWIFEDRRIVDGRKRRLGMLSGGRAWEYMEENFFPEMRNVQFWIVWERVEESVPLKECPVEDYDMERGDSVANVPVVTGEREIKMGSGRVGDSGLEIEDRTFIALLKTNMLYDVVAVPSIGLEVALSANWSVGVNWMYAWWSRNTRQRFWRVYGGDLELRRWFSSRRDGRPWLTGHHVGVYGQMLTYDVEWGGNGYLGDRWSWGVGLSYGYSMPVGRCFNIDFSLGVGYLEGDYMKYRPKDNCYVWEFTRKRKWFGPTKAEVSLVWYIGGYRKREGGVK